MVSINESLFTMDLIQAVKFYIIKMTEDCGPGMKVLLMDKITVSILHIKFMKFRFCLHIYLSNMLKKQIIFKGHMLIWQSSNILIY